MTPLAVILAMLIGLSLGLLGGGGSTLTVPVFVYLLHMTPKEAIAASLVVVGSTSLLGAVIHGREGNVRVRVAATVGLFTMAGAYGGAALASLLTGAAQLGVFGVLLIISAAAMLRRETCDSRQPIRLEGPSDHEKLLLLAAQGIGIGLLTGLVGAGGGFLLVPALIQLSGLSMREAVGTSLAVIAMNSAAGLLGYVEHVQLEWSVIAAFTLIASIASYAGVRLACSVSQLALKRGFGFLAGGIGLFILGHEIAALAHLS